MDGQFDAELAGPLRVVSQTNVVGSSVFATGCKDGLPTAYSQDREIEGWLYAELRRERERERERECTEAER